MRADRELNTCRMGLLLALILASGCISVSPQKQPVPPATTQTLGAAIKQAMTERDTGASKLASQLATKAGDGAFEDRAKAFATFLKDSSGTTEAKLSALIKAANKDGANEAEFWRQIAAGYSR